MKIPEELGIRVTTGSMQELWETFINLEGEYEDFEDEYNAVRFGVQVKFEIYDLWENTKNILRKDKDAKVIINGKTYAIDVFRTEKEIRRRIMTKAIMNNIADKDLTKPR